MARNGDWAERREGPIDRRISELEDKYDVIINRLDAIDHTLFDITALKNQITGVLNFLRFVGWGGIATCGIFLLRYIIKDMVGK